MYIYTHTHTVPANLIAAVLCCEKGRGVCREASSRRNIELFCHLGYSKPMAAQTGNKRSISVLFSVASFCFCLAWTQIREEIDKFGIKVYQFPECDSDEDEEFKQQDRELKVRNLLSRALGSLAHGYVGCSRRNQSCPVCAKGLC